MILFCINLKRIKLYQSKEGLINYFQFLFIVLFLIKSFRNWVSLATRKYETYSLIGDLYEKYENYLSKKDKENFGIKVYNEFNNVISNNNNINKENNNDSGYQLKKEVIDLIRISKYKNYKNRYIINLSYYNKNKLKIDNDISSFISFGQLDIDPKINIKNYQEFNYGKLYLRYIEVR